MNVVNYASCVCFFVDYIRFTDTVFNGFVDAGQVDQCSGCKLVLGNVNIFSL